MRSLSALTGAFFLAGSYSDERRRGFEAGHFADYCDHLALGRPRALAAYRRLQGFFAGGDMPILPSDSIDEVCGLGGAYQLDDLVAELLGELGIARSDGEIRAALEREGQGTSLG
ncbi:MAG TPA: hypothetical protein VGE07_01460 [Herpetosiphonaceae bacterium]